MSEHYVATTIKVPKRSSFKNFIILKLTRNITKEKKLKKLIAIIIILAIGIGLFNYFNVEEKVYKLIYPIKFSEHVEKYAEEYNIDKMLVYSIIKAESNFNPNAKSKSSAIGLMQVMEATAIETAEDLGYLDITEENLYNPELNIQIGVKYFSKLLSLYDNTNLAIIAYNAGIGNVDKWIESGTINKDGSDIENVPFNETENYVRKILRDYEIYKQIYK